MAAFGAGVGNPGSGANINALRQRRIFLPEDASEEA